MLVALALGAAVSAPGLFADEDLAAALGPIDPAPGAWVEYLVTRGGGGEARVRVTALAAGSAGRYWLEVAAASGSGIAGATRLLVRSDGHDVERMEVMLAGQQPLRIPLEGLGRPARSMRPTAAAKRLGAARVRVPGGTFAAEVLRISEARVWRAAGIPLWGVVKARSRKSSVELLAFGLSGGRSVFPAGQDQGNGSESEK
jgi:hypothetical protein